VLRPVRRADRPLHRRSQVRFPWLRTDDVVARVQPFAVLRRGRDLRGDLSRESSAQLSAGATAERPCSAGSSNASALTSATRARGERSSADDQAPLFCADYAIRRVVTTATTNVP
jgi:hypothetical protein